MIELKEKTLLSFLYKIKDKVETLNEKQLFSWTEEMEAVDFLDVFEAAKQTNENRIFWTNSDNDFRLLGIGSVREIMSHHHRFQESQREWECLLQKAVIHNPFEEMGTGITALGGMAFDPTRKKNDLWKKYPSMQLTIPALVLTYTNGKYFMTTNRFLDVDESATEVSDKIAAFKASIFSKPDNEPTTAQKIINKAVVNPFEWKEIVQKAVDQIKQNRAKKIVLAREIRVTLNKDANISNMLRRLLSTQTNSYVFAFEQGDHCFIGATPERLVLLEGNQLLSTCLAGTAPRGETKEADETIANDLLKDEKNLEEHTYVVQMIKENIEEYCENIHIPNRPVIYPLRNLQHLYTPVTATLKAKHTVFDIVRKLHPTPALGGVPRDKAMQFIREEECMDRGWYGAPIGWLDSNDNSEFAVAIRSGLVQKNEVSLFAGCGVMRDSDPEMEFEETSVKLLPMLNVLEDHDGSY